MVLDGEDGQFFVAQALHRAVVQVDVGHLQPILDGVRVEGVAVVLGGDVDSAGIQVSDGVIAAAVAELQLEGPGAEGSADKLAAEADAHYRLLAHQLSYRVHDVVQQCGVARAGGKQYAIRFHTQDFLCRCRAG